MKLFIAKILIFVLYSGSIQSQDLLNCGTAKRNSGFIVHGDQFKRGDFPWIVALLYTGFSPPSYFCGGSLISSRHVVTAAHCIKPKYGEAFFNQLYCPDIIAFFGAHNLSNSHEIGKLVLSPEEIHIHEEWNPNIVRYDADIALLIFEENSIHLSNNIQPVCLWSSEAEPTEREGVVAGWGRSEDESRFHEIIPKKVKVPMHSNEDCFLETPQLAALSSKRTFCAGLQNGSGVCLGDSGNGFFVKDSGFYFLKGIVSSSRTTATSCDVTKYAVYTNVHKFRDWLGKFVKFPTVSTPRPMTTTTLRASVLPRPTRPKRQNPCMKSSCYPKPGNILIGRESKLTATSTCGANRKEIFCSHSALIGKKCYTCDSRAHTIDDVDINHSIQQIVHKFKPETHVTSWWQSEFGEENVSIQLDLEAEFQITHMIITFATYRPAAMIIERSNDFNRTWEPYRYFASNCSETFPGVPTRRQNFTDVICSERYSSIEPSENGELIFEVWPPKLKIEDPYLRHINNWLRITNLRMNFVKFQNHRGSELHEDENNRKNYYYAISHMVLSGSCSCYGHAYRCLPDTGDVSDLHPDMVHGFCDCKHNTRGANCEKCKDFHNDLPWKPAYGTETNHCRKCNCNSRSQTCHFEPSVFEMTGRESGGVCENCKTGFYGKNCEQKIEFDEDEEETD